MQLYIASELRLVANETFFHIRCTMNLTNVHSNFNLISTAFGCKPVNDYRILDPGGLWKLEISDAQGIQISAT